MKKMNSKVGNKVFGTMIAICGFTLVGLLLNSNCRAGSQRDLKYEAYCDSIFKADPDYYLDVLCTTDEYQDYLEEHGQWWDDEEDCPAYLHMKAANDFKKELLEAEENCIKRAEYLMLMNGIHDEEYNRCKFVVDSLYATQL